MSITPNKKLLKWICPIDNAFPENTKIGAYHIRIWYYGEWVDVVVDDSLPITKTNNLLFCHNYRQRNEFWHSLIEKAFAK